MFEYYIAKRYLNSKHKLSFITILSFISTIGVTIGVAALVIVLSVFNGFGSLVTSMLTNFDPHLRITLPDNSNNDFAMFKKNLDEIKGIKSYAPYAEGKIILIKNKTLEILNLKGINEKNEENSSRIKNRLTFGEYDLENKNGIGKIVLSLPIALKLSLRIGDTVFATSAAQIKNTITRMSIPKTMPLEVTGIYEIANKEYALEYSFSSLQTSQQLLNLANNISGIEIYLYDLNNSENVKNELIASNKFNNYTIYTWFDLHKDLYTVMQIERWAAYMLLSLIIAVAVFNILSSLTMSVLEKQKDIGVLRSMGATKLSIKKIFMFEGVLVGIIGTIAGLALGLIICFLQIKFNFYSLDASKFIIDYLPVEVRFSDIIVISLMSLFLTFIASRYPANKALKTNLIDAIKWE